MSAHILDYRPVEKGSVVVSPAAVRYETQDSFGFGTLCQAVPLLKCDEAATAECDEFTVRFAAFSAGVLLFGF